MLDDKSLYSRLIRLQQGCRGSTNLNWWTTDRLMYTIVLLLTTTPFWPQLSSPSGNVHDLFSWCWSLSPFVSLYLAYHCLAGLRESSHRVYLGHRGAGPSIYNCNIIVTLDCLQSFRGRRSIRSCPIEYTLLCTLYFQAIHLNLIILNCKGPWFR
jgi:hypothetical protein